MKIVKHTNGTEADFENILGSSDEFHDWVVKRVTVIAKNNPDEPENHMFAKYTAELTLFDPYKRFDHQTVDIIFDDVDKVSLSGFSKLGSEILGMSFEQKPSEISFSSVDGEHLSITAERLTYQIF